jgi:hypothetical protein
MALSQGQMRIVGAVLAFVLIGGAVGIVVYQMKKPGKVLVVDTGSAAPAKGAGAAPMEKGKPVSGVVVSGDGKPVSGVEVVLVPEGYGFDLNGPRPQSFPNARSDKDGKFDFPQPSAWSDLAVISDTGFAQVGRTEMPSDGKIVMRPWGRVEGTYLVGKTPQPNQQLLLYPINMGRAVPTTDPSNPYRLVTSGGRVRISQRATTDAQGRFIFERVGPGPMLVSKSVITGRMSRSINLANVDVRAGETALVEIGGKGRPVIGRVVVDRKEEALPPIVGSIDLMQPAPTGGRRAFAPGPDWPKLSEQERQRLVDEWMPTIRHLQLQVSVAVAADGTFRAEDVPAGQHSIRMYSQSLEPGSASIEIAADVTVPLAISPMPDGRSDEPFDTGTITLKVRPRVKVGAAAPAVEAVKADGSVVKLSDYRGKYVLLSMVYDYGTMQQPQTAELVRMGGVLADRFEDNGMVMLAVMLPQRQMGTQHAIANIPGWITAAIANWEQKLDPAYANSRGSYLIDPQGTVLAKLGSYGNMAYGAVDKMLGVMKRRGPGVVVSIEKLTGSGASKAFAFQTIPTISKDDAGQAATFSIVDGRKAGFGGELEIFNDGLGPRHDRDERLMLSFDPNTVEGRIAADLGKAIDVEAINTYAWYRDSHRWAQVYRVYGSDGSAAGFNAAPKIGTNPATCGWTFIADVDTRQTPGGTDLRDDDRGQSGVNIHGEKGSLGKYRYLLFVTFASETQNAYGQEFWSEIDVVGK